jgi:hypothetical protein
MNVKVWACHRCRFELCEPCLKINLYLGNCHSLKFPYQDFLYKEKDHNFYPSKVSSIGHKFKNKEMTYDNPLFLYHQKHKYIYKRQKYANEYYEEGVEEDSEIYGLDRIDCECL